MDVGTAHFYDCYAEDGRAAREAARSALSACFGEAFAPGGRILDVGCGAGRDLAVLLAQGHDAYGLEPNDAMRALARRRHPALAGRLAAGELPWLGEPFGGRFDGIVCSAVLMHVPPERLADALAAMRALLMPGGRLLASAPAMREDLVAGGRDPDGRLFHNHVPETLAAAARALGLRPLARPAVAHGDLVHGDTRWHVLLFERTPA